MKKITVDDLAKRFGKDPSHIRRVAIDYGLGELLFGRIRVFSKKDTDRMARIFAEKGRLSKNSQNLAQVS